GPLQKFLPAPLPPTDLLLAYLGLVYYTLYTALFITCFFPLLVVSSINNKTATILPINKP
ncbi:hypothetical protein LZ30DRAFT_633940, partial [Colletotrichum cereale]